LPSFLESVRERGFVHQCTDAERLEALLREGPAPAYIGFDCTADSLHVGSLVSIMLLRRYQQAGHKPIVLMGGGTTKVGDPSGKEEARPLLSDAQIAANLAGMRGVFEQVLTCGDGLAIRFQSFHDSAGGFRWISVIVMLSMMHRMAPMRTSAPMRALGNGLAWRHRPSVR